MTQPAAATSTVAATIVHGFVSSPMSLDADPISAVLPPLTTAVATLAAHIEQEQRSDIEVSDSAPLRLGTSDGFLVTPERRFAIERNGLKSLLARIGIFPRAFAVLSKALPERRAKFFNGMMRDYADEVIGNELVLRTRKTCGVRAVYAVVSPTYARCDGDEVMAHVGSVLKDSGALGRASYNAETTAAMVQALWPCEGAPGTEDSPAFIGVHVTTRDDTGGSVVVCGYYAFGSVTLPGASKPTPLALLFPEDASLTYRRRHTGDVGVFAGKLLAHARSVRDAVAGVLETWKAMAEVPALSMLPGAAKAAKAAAAALGDGKPTQQAENLAVLAAVAAMAAPGDKGFNSTLVAAYDAQALPETHAVTIGDCVKAVALTAIYGDTATAEVGAGRVLVSFASKYGKAL